MCAAEKLGGAHLTLLGILAAAKDENQRNDNDPNAVVVIEKIAKTVVHHKILLIRCERERCYSLLDSII